MHATLNLVREILRRAVFTSLLIGQLLGLCDPAADLER
jgi:hypothetical protein